VYCSLLYSIIYSKICEMLCRRKSCVVKEEEDDEKFFEKALQQNKTNFGLTPSKNSKFLQDFGVF